MPDPLGGERMAWPLEGTESPTRMPVLAAGLTIEIDLRHGTRTSAILCHWLQLAGSVRARVALSEWSLNSKASMIFACLNPAEKVRRATKGLDSSGGGPGRI